MCALWLVNFYTQTFDQSAPIPKGDRERSVYQQDNQFHTVSFYSLKTIAAKKGIRDGIAERIIGHAKEKTSKIFIPSA
ncbi:MAG TPA: hypothetical protein PKC55_10265 [Dysgonomonas sp.]|uniref:hypothetical protein n=1 Tax=Dysgonomonas sp. TaxID=1891233 RepID=UPI002D13D865|nr:hypothetical protein [Dysgonomonas sp.]HML65203.1 hypothetical protein [Dysgonomonas sp.]